MLIYTFDGSFSGLLTAIFEAYYRHQEPDEITLKENGTSLFSEIGCFIDTDELKSNRVAAAITQKIGMDAYHFIYWAFLSELPGCFTYIYQYLKLGFKIGPNINSYFQNNIVRMVQLYAKKVRAERHRMLGFLRFRSANNLFYYARFEPDHNITALLAPHFTTRLKNENWLIHDCKREIAAVYDTKEWFIVELSRTIDINIQFTPNNNTYESLWKEYFNAATIKERMNLKSQLRCMPKRYWSNLPEMHN